MGNRRKLYALLVGVNKYDPDSIHSIPTLEGCEKDVEAMKTILSDGEVIPEEVECHIAPPLVNEKATYKNIISQFRAHLGQAQAGDTALFMFSGHGSREVAPAAFERYYPEGKMETMVCYDSRTACGKDLADKELGMLIEEIAVNGAHVCIILDCCHSGSGTRQLDLFPRQAPSKTASRQYEDLLFGEYAKRYPLPKTANEPVKVPSAKHVLLAACDRSEEAYEAHTKEGRRGLFSYCLEQVLREKEQLLSYKSLFETTRSKLLQYVTNKKQSPALQAYSGFNVFDGFLALGPGENPRSPAEIFYSDGLWRVNRGVINGNLPIGDNPTYFQCFLDGKKVGQVRTEYKGVVESTITFIAEPEEHYETNRYQAFMLNQSGDLLPIRLSGEDEALITEFRQDIETYQLQGNFFEFVEGRVDTEYQLHISRRAYRIIRTADKCTIAQFDRALKEVNLIELFTRLEDYGVWERLLKVNNDTAFQAYEDEIDFELVIQDQKGRELGRYAEPEVQVTIPIVGGKKQALRYHLEVKNKSEKQAWHCALIYMDEEYTISTDAVWGFNEKLAPGKSGLAKGDNNTLYLKQEEHEFTDIFKLFVSKEKIDVGVLAQKLTKRVTTRRVSASKDEPKLSQWFTKTIRVRLTSEQAEAGKAEWTAATGKLKIKAHPNFSAKLGLETTISTRDTMVEPYAIIADYARRFGQELLPLGADLGYIGAPNSVVLSELHNADTLAKRPLEIQIKAEADRMTVLPIALEEGYILPVGDVRYKEDGDTEIQFKTLPEQPATRSLRQAARLCFLKLVFQEDPYYLRRVSYEQEKPVLIKSGIVERVADAEHILVLIHGLLGNTKKMAEVARQQVAQGEIDLVLAFDYENLSSSLDGVAEQLDILLKSSGLHSEDGKKVTLLAHGMGGLVARHLVEQLEAYTYVDSLILVGVPNGGSALADLATWRDRLFIMTTLAMNFTPSIPISASLAAFLGQSKLFTRTLEQMRHDNLFIRALNANRESFGVAYHCIVGNMQSYFKEHAEEKKLLEKLLQKNAELFFQEQNNDLFSSQESMKNIPAGWLAQPVQEVQCHHLNYFEAAAGVEAVQAALKG